MTNYCHVARVFVSIRSSLVGPASRWNCSFRLPSALMTSLPQDLEISTASWIDATTDPEIRSFWRHQDGEELLQKQNNNIQFVLTMNLQTVTPLKNATPNLVVIASFVTSSYSLRSNLSRSGSIERRSSQRSPLAVAPWTKTFACYIILPTIEMMPWICFCQEFRWIYLKSDGVEHLQNNTTPSL